MKTMSVSRKPKRHEVHIAITVGIVSAVIFHLVGFPMIALLVGTSTNVAWLWEDRLEGDEDEEA